MIKHGQPVYVRYANNTVGIVRQQWCLTRGGPILRARLLDFSNVYKDFNLGELEDARQWIKDNCQG